jgi:DNA topoisomerase-2
MDGLKVSQRKILYSAFKKNLTQEIKVAQFSGYVSENSGYHHGEASLNGAIVNMAQDFVGSNNIHLFSPNGQFGTRLQGGKDSASERYIFTKLEKITRTLFPKKDDAILTYLDDDGLSVEPIFYAPIIPMILVNGAKGIGTGFSTEVHCYNPKQIVQYLVDTLEGKQPNKEFVPYFRGFKGTIERETEKRFLSRGVYSIKKNVVEVTELPIGTWNEDYLIFLDKLVDEGILKDFTDLSTDKVVHMKLVLAKDLEGDELVKALKLYSYLSTSNMNLFNHEEKLVHFNEVHEICDAFMEQRLGYYLKRKEFLLKHLREEIVVLQNRHRYIQECLAETIDLRRKTSSQITELLTGKKYDLQQGTFHYLTKMSMDSVCEENVTHLREQFESKQKELDETNALTEQQMWIKELKELEIML